MKVLQGNPLGSSVSGAEISLASEAAGDVMYFDGTDWVRLAKGTANQRLSMNAGATAPDWQTVSNAWTLIGNATIGTAASISIASIAAGYQDLMGIWWVVSDATAANTLIRFNNDSAGNYAFQETTSSATSVAGTNNTSQSSIVAIGATAGSKIFGGVFFVRNISTLMKTVQVMAGEETNNGHLKWGNWNNTSDEINRVDLVKASGNWTNGRFRLYGSTA